MKRLNFVFILLLIFTNLLNINNIYAKNYYFKRVYTEIYINKDGSFDVSIERTYHFSGSFSWGTYYIDKKGFSEIQDFSLRDEYKEYEKLNYDSKIEGTYLFEDQGDRYFIKFYYTAQDQDKTFYFKYKVIGGIKSYLDISDFYWKVIEDKWERETREFECKIFFSRGDKRRFFLCFCAWSFMGKHRKN